MSAFEYFFSFYGLLLGLSVAAVVGGFANVLHERARVRFGWLTPLLAVFVAVDIATFWSQAWVIFRGAPFNLALLVVGLTIAAVFYVAASITFPRMSADSSERVNLDDHFWAHRRTIFACVMAANLIVALLLIPLALVDEGFGRVAQSVRLWAGLTFFVGATATAAFSRRKRVVRAALVLLVLYHCWNVGLGVMSLIASNGWSPPTA
ncbi:hypothetical protein ACO2Q1_13230 [Brevundimonas sp. VNH65]|uniref:hypothetical protein n=1 Tax=Brevundimonas sp. VNH65 TaxID=3400917 RepID=UPI003C01E554